MSFYKIVDSEGEGIKLLGDVPSTASTGDFLVWSYDSSSSNWLAAKGINFISLLPTGNNNVVNFQVKTTQGKSTNLLLAFESINTTNPDIYNIVNFNKFRTLHKNNLAIVEVNAQLKKGSTTDYDSANILIEYRKANSDGSIAEDNYLKLQQNELHSNPIETNNFNIGFEGDLKVHKHSGDAKKVAAWDETGKLIKTEFDPGSGGGTPLPDAVENRMLYGSRVFNQNIPSTWVMSNNLFYEEYADDGMDTLWTISNSSTANTNSTFNYSTIREHLTNYGLKSYFDMETIKGDTDSRAVLSHSTEVSNFTDNTSSSKTTYSIYDSDGESHLTIMADSKREVDIEADNWRIQHDGGLKVNKYVGINGLAYFDGSGTLLKSVNSPVRSSAEVRVTPTVGQNTHSFGIRDFRVQEFSEDYTFLYDNIKYLKAFLIRPDGNGEYYYFSASSEIIQRRKVNVTFNEVFQDGDALLLRIDYVIPT